MVQKRCEKCQDFLPNNSEHWKTLCIKCYKEKLIASERILEKMGRVQEDTFVGGQPKFEGIQNFYKRKGGN